MSQNPKAKFAARASLFASPVGSSAVPKKKVAREAPRSAPIFQDESVIQEKTVEIIKTPEKAPAVQSAREPEEPEEEDDEVEPMEVDTSEVPSPQKVFPPTPLPDKSCATSTTPRRKSARKSMPTPGKRLFFTSKDAENESQRADETTQLELLMASCPEEMPGTMKNLITDRKEMNQYLVTLKREIEEFDAIRKSRQTMLKNATEIVSENQISSTVACHIAPLDLTLRREETPAEVVRRLHGSFVAKTQEAGQQRTARKKAAIEEENNQMLKNQIKRLEEVKEQKEQLETEVQELYEQERIALEKTSQKMERVDNLMQKFKPIPMIF